MSSALDPLLKDLGEKKQRFRRNVLCMAEELLEMRGHLASQQQLVANETLIRREAESKLQKVEEEVRRIEKSLEERSAQLEASVSVNEMYVKELDGLRATADASAECAQSAQRQCLALAKELEEKNWRLKEHERRVNKLGEQLERRKLSQMQLRDEVSTMAAGPNKDCELRKILDELEKHPRVYQVKKKVLKLKFCMQRERAQTRKLQRMGERREKAVKELRDLLAADQQAGSSGLDVITRIFGKCLGL